MGQDVFRSPSVFNFFPPDHIVFGDALLGPEFGIYTTSTALARINFAFDVVYRKVAISADRPKGTWLDLAPLAHLTKHPDHLITVLDQLMLHGTMPPGMREVVHRAITAIPESHSLERVQAAVYLIASSPFYLVER